MPPTYPEHGEGSREISGLATRSIRANALLDTSLALLRQRLDSESARSALPTKECLDMGLLRRLFRMNRDSYQLEALVSSRVIELLDESSSKFHVICDLDKTYVETEFESWVKMARIPFERPHEKITVPGASEVLQELRWSRVEAAEGQTLKPSVGLHFVSSSPPQLRSALEGKLILDNLDWTSDTFKNQSYNLRMARIDLLRHHIAYKTKAILDIVQRIPHDSEVYLVGDNAEYDGFIYTGVKLFLDRLLTVDGLGQWLASAHVEPVVIQQVLRGAEITQERGSRISGIFIRKLPQYPMVDAVPLSQNIYYFESWIQIAWIWMCRGLISEKSLWKLVRSFHNVHGLNLSHMMWALGEIGLREEIKIPGNLVEQCAQVIERCRERKITSKQHYSWRLESYHIRNHDIADVTSTSALAKGWYKNIEAGRGMRQTRRS